MKQIIPAFIPALKKKKKQNKIPVKKEKQKDIKFDDPNFPDMAEEETEDYLDTRGTE